MNSIDFVHDFTEWIKTHTSVEALYISDTDSGVVLYAVTSEKKTFLQNSMIFTGYGYTSYCKLFNFSDIPYLEIEFLSGDKAIIEFIPKDYEFSSHHHQLFDRR